MQFPAQFPAEFPRPMPFAGDPIAALRSALLPGAAQLVMHPLALGYMYQDRAGTQPVTASGQLVGRVRDIGGGGYDAVAVSDAARGVVTFASGKWTLALNGVNTTYQSATLAEPGVNCAQVLAAVRKLEDTVGTRAILEYGQAISTDGAMAVYGPEATVQAGFSAWSRGTISKWATGPTGTHAAPISAVLTAQSQISADALTLRLNGVQIAQNTGDQGAGNFTAQKITWGSRAGTIYFFSGLFCGFLPIIRFSANPPTDAQIAAAEAILTRALV